MAHSNNPAMNSFWQAYSDRSTRLAARIAEDFDDEVLEVKPGHDVLAMQVGQQVTSTGLGAVKAGAVGVIAARQIVNGHARYLVFGQWLTTQDVQAVGRSDGQKSKGQKK